MGKKNWPMRVLVFLTGLMLAGCGLTPGSTGTFGGASASQSSLGDNNAGGSGGLSIPAPTPSSSLGGSVSENVMNVTVGGTGLCGADINAPCASVTICVPGTNQCQTISNLLIDTGSYGLRVFSQVISLSLPNVKDGAGNPVAECAQFGTGTDWGPVVTADVHLGSEPSVQVPIQEINSAYGKIPASSGCTSPDTSPMQAGFNGILGVGLFAQDCGLTCAQDSTVGIYYSCNGTSCAGTTLALTEQVQNPVSLLPVDNNGVILDLPAITATGAQSVAGTLTFGIGTESNNVPTGVATYAADNFGNFITKFNGQTYSQSFIDSGSNGLFFPAPASLTSCTSGPATGWFCPASTTSYTGTNSGSSGTPTGTEAFQIGNSTDLFSSKNVVFNDVGADSSSSGFSSSFDWGLPFFFGKKVYVGIEGTRSPAGTGPYWAY